MKTALMASMLFLAILLTGVEAYSMTDSNPDLAAIDNELNDFDPEVRAEALCSLAARMEAGQVRLPPVKSEVNLHFHTFFSYNANGWSPSRIAWEAKKYGLAVAGIVDFDVLDGMEEFLAAGEIIGQRAVAAMESRVFLSEYSREVINSPNEPGITYFMAGGCYRMPPDGSPGVETLQMMRDMARRRNIQMMDRVNGYLDKVCLDYDADVLPLTPSGNATERHMLAAYDAKARQVFGDNQPALVTFWAAKLGVERGEMEAMLADRPKFHEKMRSKLMKYGGVGYVAPTVESFPSIEMTIEMMREMGALPTATWLDGVSSGESDMPAMLELLESKGVVALNIIPDRNWNIKAPEEKRMKVENLGKAVEAARAIGFPLCVGTEMNKAGLPFVDDFSAPELQPFIEDFLHGAHFFFGHSFLARAADMGAASDWADAHFREDRRLRNEFYTKVGRAVSPADAARVRTARDLRSLSASEVLRTLGAQ